MKYRSKIPFILIAILSLAACAKKAVYIDESFSNDSPFKLRVDGDVALGCESARRSLLGQGYLIELANSDEVKARKATRGENTFIEMNIVCVPESNGSTIFATGVLSTYDLKKNSSSASVGLSALGSISLPIGQSVDSLVKVSEETIDDEGFYKRFFTAVDTLLVAMEAGRAPAVPLDEPAEEAPAVEYAPPSTQSAIWPELFPEQPAPDVGPDPLPGPVEAETLPESFSESAAPVVTMPAPVTPAEPVKAEGALSGFPALAPDEEPLGISPVSGPEEEPLGITPTPAPGAEPTGISPAPLVTDKGPAAAESGLAPIETTAVKKTAPADEPQDEPVERIEDLF